MLTFKTEPVPSAVDRTLSQWLQRQFDNVFRAANRSVSYVALVELHAEPDKPQDYMLVAADGTDWNPAAGGQGIYTYYAGAWHKLG